MSGPRNWKITGGPWGATTWVEVAPHSWRFASPAQVEALAAMPDYARAVAECEAEQEGLRKARAVLARQEAEQEAEAATEMATRLATAIVKGTPIYIRAGRPAGRSYNHRDGHAEPGTSVYAGWRVGCRVYIDLREVDAVSAHLILAGRQLYEVAGQLLETRGGDGEPLLRGCKVIKPIPYWQVIV